MGKSFVAPAVQLYECPVCGEKIYDREAMRLIESHYPAKKSTSVRRKAS
jgi:hypothetical protein